MTKDYTYIEMSPNRFDKMNKWCAENLYHGGHYEPKWYSQFPFIVFYNKKEYILFLLRWA
jgi:hypothetical protein